VRNLRELPKAPLHLHVDGAMRPETLAELARKYGVEAPMPTSYGSFDAVMATTDSQLAAVARTSILSSAAPAGLVRSALADIEAWLA
jgi:adenosine deaminase